jgi:hypothetical protein
MGFTYGRGTIEPGHTQRWWYSWGIFGEDRGSQYAMANPLNPGVSLLTFEQIKERKQEGGVRYWVTFRNISTFPTVVNVQGGGQT